MVQVAMVEGSITMMVDESGWHCRCEVVADSEVTTRTKMVMVGKAVVDAKTIEDRNDIWVDVEVEGKAPN